MLIKAYFESLMESHQVLLMALCQRWQGAMCEIGLWGSCCMRWRPMRH